MSRISNMLNSRTNCYDRKSNDLNNDFDVFADWAKAANKEYKIVDNDKQDSKYAKYEYKISNDKVNHPQHYQGHQFEVIDIIDDYNLGFNLGNAIKYILRAGKKDDYCQDLSKAIWYLNREVLNNAK